jgi:hypothetical protein
VASKLARHSGLDRAYFAEPAADHRQATTQPLYALCSSVAPNRRDPHPQIAISNFSSSASSWLVLRRTARRPRWRVSDRLILGALGRKLSAGALLLVQLATILGWHRALVHHRWAAFGRRRSPGRPRLPAECRESWC